MGHRYRHGFVNWLESKLFGVLQIPPEPELVFGDRVRDAGVWRQEHRVWWLALPWYGHLANRLLLALRRTGSTYGATRQTARHALNRVDLWRAERALAQARTLIYTSYYIHDLDRETEIEGYFDLRRGLSYGLTIRSLASFEDLARFQWEQGSVDQLDPVPYAKEVVVPTRRIGPEQVPEVLRRWYIDRFDWKWRHWSQREGGLPDFEVRLRWSRPASLWTKLKKLAGSLVKAPWSRA